jgi:hypothetical protein
LRSEISQAKRARRLNAEIRKTSDIDTKEALPPAPPTHVKWMKQAEAIRELKKFRVDLTAPTLSKWANTEPRLFRTRPQKNRSDRPEVDFYSLLIYAVEIKRLGNNLENDEEPTAADNGPSRRETPADRMRAANHKKQEERGNLS